MTAEYVRRYYGVDYKRGERVTVNGQPGTVMSFPGQHLGVRFDGTTFTTRAHPTWRVERINQCAHCKGLEAPDGTCTDCAFNAGWVPPYPGGTNAR